MVGVGDAACSFPPILVLYVVRPGGMDIAERRIRRVNLFILMECFGSFVADGG